MSNDRKQLWFNRIMWFIFGMLIMSACFMLSGCSWQGQRHPVILPDNTVAMAEWWSMRAFWMSNGIEAYNETPYWRTGFRAETSKSDPNSIEAAGTAGGKIIGQAAGAVIR